MKKLMKIRLINWHRFYNETIIIGDSALLSGENGAGKSTILDAIQFVITASKTHFNKAAHENGKRKLDGYVRCKTGKENRPYERTGFVTAHVALEFYEESKKNSFIIGAVVDSAVPEKEPSVIWYLMEGVTFKDELFFQGMTPRAIDNFKAANKSHLKQVTKVQIDAKKIFKNKFGRIDDKFFDLIPKSLAFKPIDDIKDFVYSYVLDRKEVNIEELKENVRTYQELEKILQVIAVKLEKLEKINAIYKDIQLFSKREKIYEYYISKVNVKINEQSILEQRTLIQKNEWTIDGLVKKQKTLNEQIESKNNQRTNLLVELNNSEEFKALSQLKGEIKVLADRLSELKGKKKTLSKDIRKSVENAVRLSEYLKEENQKNIFIEYQMLFSNLASREEFIQPKQVLESVLTEKKRLSESVRLERFQTDTKLKILNEEIVKTKQLIARLNEKKLNYPDQVLKLLREISLEAAKINRKVEPRILCELLHITKPRFTNAVEGYLNTQRFYLLVEPQDFDFSLSVYRRLKEKERFYGVGLINTGKLDDFEKTPEGTLAECVTSDSVYAKRYINMILGKVVCCEKAEQLKQYPTAITPSCMKYQNHVLSAIKPEIYETPYIGQEAYKVQLEQAEHHLGELNKEAAILKQQIDELKEIDQCLDTDSETSLKFNFDVFLESKEKELRYEQAKKDEAELKRNTTYLEKQIQLDTLEKAINELSKEDRQLSEGIGGCKTTIEAASEKIKEYQSMIAQLELSLKEAEQKVGADLATIAGDFEQLLLQKEMNKIKKDYETARTGNFTRKTTATNDLIQAMSAYKSAHDFGAEASLAGYSAFFEEYDKLKNSEVLKYQEKVILAKQKAEEEFREQFLSKLQENIKKAQQEMKQLNKALENISFGSEKYRFEFPPSKKYSMYYDMIMDDFNVLEGKSIFSGIFNETHREVIEELFSKLTAEGENQTKVLEEFTDYRTYLDYDIRIDHGDGSFSYYSKVCEEKSGGETQTPFYVTVAASFIQLYTNSVGQDSIGLILFDEAFNNMDDERIAGVLEFFTSQKMLQIIVAAPPEKIQYIEPAIQNTLLVLKDNEVSYVERYVYEGV